VAGGLGWGGCLTLEYKYKQHEKNTQIKSENKRKNPGPRMHHCGSQTICLKVGMVAPLAFPQIFKCSRSAFVTTLE